MGGYSRDSRAVVPGAHPARTSLIINQAAPRRALSAPHPAAGRPRGPPNRRAHRREGPQDLDAVLRGEGVRRVHAGEVGQARGRVRGRPAQHVAELGRVGVDRVPGDQELGGGGAGGRSQGVLSSIPAKPTRAATRTPQPGRSTFTPLSSGCWPRSSRRPRRWLRVRAFLPWPPPAAPYLDGFWDVTNGSRVQAHQTRHLVANGFRVFEPAGAGSVGGTDGGQRRGAWD